MTARQRSPAPGFSTAMSGMTARPCCGDGGTISRHLCAERFPPSTKRIDATGQLLVPGFIDLQVNGGGGVMLNDKQDVDAIRRSARPMRNSARPPCCRR